MKRVLFFLFLAACSDHKPTLSPDVSTRDISIAVNASDHEVVATLTGPGGYVVLLPPDHLSFASGSMEWPAVHVANTYVADIGNTSGLVSLRLSRTSDESVEQAFVIPPPFSVKAPALMSRGAGMTFTWDGQISNAKVAFGLRGACIKGLDRALGIDTGTYALNPGELESSGMIETTCDVTLTITRTYSGAEPSASTLAGFSASFVNKASITFTSSP